MMHKIRLWLVVAVALLASVPVASAASGDPILQRWTVPGSPQSVAVQSDTVGWMTLPQQNALVRVTINAAGAANTTVYNVPTPASQPYAVVVANGIVWFTEQAANKIGRLDPTSGTWKEYPIPTAASEPSGLAVAATAPNAVWFVERSGNRVGLLTVDGALAGTFTEYALPWVGSQPEELVLAANGDIWLTAAATGRLARFRPSLGQDPSAWANVGTGVGSRPWAVALDGEGNPWITERQTGRIGVYLPQTYADIRWYSPPTSSSDPIDIAARGDSIAFVERATDRAGLLNTISGSTREYGLAGTKPTSLAFASDGCLWIAASGTNELVRWCGPYFRRVALPNVQRN